MIRVLVADDHSVVREGLKRILAGEPGLQVVAEARDGDEVLPAADRSGCDLVLLDIGMPGRDWLDVIEALKLRSPPVRVIVLSVYAEEQFAVRALRSGASAYLNKSSAADELLAAIRTVARGQRYVTASLGQTLAARLGGDPDRPLHASLSEREFQILRLIGSGRTVGEIARLLNLSPKTVSTYRRRILEKLGMKTSAELTHYAVTAGLIGDLTPSPNPTDS